MKGHVKRKKILGVTIAAGFLVIAVAAVCFAWVKQPQWRLTKGLVNLGTELSRYYNPVLAEAEGVVLEGAEKIWWLMFLAERL